MGLLDDAIREHLDLKRRRGADPGEVAREQREVLESPGREDSAGDTDSISAEEIASPDELSPVEQPSREAGSSEPPNDFSAVGQETAELDMQAMLDADGDPPPVASDQTGPPFAGAPRVISSPQEPEPESLEWEMPPRTSGAAEPQLDGRADAHGDHGSGAGQWDAQPRRIISESSPELDAEIPGQERIPFE